MVAQERKLLRGRNFWATGCDDRSLGRGELRFCRTDEGCPSEVEGRCLYILVLFFFFDLDAEGFEELQILIADFEFGVGR